MCDFGGEGVGTLPCGLGYTKVTDAGLKELASLKSLETLSLRGTKVTDAAVKELQEALPDCRISR